MYAAWACRHADQRSDKKRRCKYGSLGNAIGFQTFRSDTQQAGCRDRAGNEYG